MRGRPEAVQATVQSPGDVRNELRGAVASRYRQKASGPRRSQIGGQTAIGI